MTPDPTQVERLAVLAGIRLDADAAERLARELSAVLEEIAVLREMELSGNEDRDGNGDGDLDGNGSLPDDGVPGPDPLEGDLSALAPDWRERYFLMPPPQAFRDGEGEEGPAPEGRPPEDPP